MEAVILAAGKGTRIQSITNGGLKALLPLGDTTLIGQSLRHLASNGVRRVVVVTGHQREDIVDYVKSNWHEAVEFVYNPHYGSTNVLYSLWLALPYMQLDDDFIFLHADTVFSSDVLNRLLTHPDNSRMVFAVDYHHCEEEEMKVRIDEGYITKITKQMPSEHADGEFLGLAKIAVSEIPRLRYHSEQIFEEGNFNAFFELAVQRMIEHDSLKVAVANVTGLPWREVDFTEDYMAAKSLFD